MSNRKRTLILLLFSMFFVNILFGQQRSMSNNKGLRYPITDADKKYIEDIRKQNGNPNDINSKFRTFNIVAYHDNNAGKINLLSDKYLEIKLDVLPLPYIGKYLKKFISIKEYARFYNVWNDSVHIQEEKHGTYIYKFLPDSSFKLLKYYGDQKRRKHRESWIYQGANIITILDNRLKGEILNKINTFVFGYQYFGVLNDFGDSISLDPNKFYVVETNRIVPIIKDKDIPIKDLYLKFDDSGEFIEGGGLIKKGFDTRVLIKELIE